jgi:hypothetical protein
MWVQEVKIEDLQCFRAGSSSVDLTLSGLTGHMLADRCRRPKWRRSQLVQGVMEFPWRP